MACLLFAMLLQAPREIAIVITDRQDPDVTERVARRVDAALRERGFTVHSREETAALLTELGAGVARPLATARYAARARRFDAITGAAAELFALQLSKALLLLPPSTPNLRQGPLHNESHSAEAFRSVEPSSAASPKADARRAR